MNQTPFELTYDDLRFEFPAPDETLPPADLIGQPRAIRALELGTAIDAPGYNIFVSGPPGTGRQTAVQHILNRLPPSTSVRDLVYVNNFLRPDNPVMLALPQGKAPLFKTKLHEIVENLKVRIRQELSGEAYKAERDLLVKKVEFHETHQISAFEVKLAGDGFRMTQMADEAESGAMDILPIFNGEPCTFEELQEKVSAGTIPEDQWNRTREHYYRHIDEMRALFDGLREARTQMEKDMQKLQIASVRPVLRRQVKVLTRAFPYFAVKVWMTTFEKDVEANLFLFTGDKGSDEPGATPAMSRYGANVLVDHGSDPKLPVVFETRATAARLFGTIEARPDPQGEARANFLMIKPGSIHLASGGYLVLRAEDILKEEESWPLLKQTLQNGQAEIQASSGPFGPMTTLKPQPAQVHLKVIIMGNAGVYDFLVQEDPDFSRLFKISAEFDPVMELNTATVNEYRVFVDSHVQKNKLLPVDPSGRQEILEFGVRIAGHRRKLTTQFSQVADLVTESAYWARKLGQAVVDRKAVSRALEERRYLGSLPEDKMDEQVTEGQILLSVTGSAIGQVNGLAVLDRGSTSFGRPMRITAVAGPGDAGIVNIEGEAGLSGEIHDKGVLILQGLIRDRFAREFPLSLSASVGFEQSYGGIDGDSASSTEAYAILSAIAGVPLRQDLAVSGSVNQRGEIQPVGGITEKVEGFYYTCKKSGLTRTQGVIIPKSNVQNLVLNPEVQLAIRDGQFHIYPVTTIDEGLFLLSGQNLGKMEATDHYPEGTLGHEIVKKLERMRASAHPKDD